LTEKKIDFETVNYFEQPLDEASLKRLLRSAGLRPRDILRSKEPAYREHVGNRDLSDEDLIRLMVKYPELMQRPIVAQAGKAVLARPVENLRKLGL
jgi:arsenate reductase